MSYDDDDVLAPDAVLGPDEARNRRDPNGTDDERSSSFVDGLAWVLDDLIQIPIIKKRVGIDGAIGMVPGLGDGAGLVASSVIILTAIRQGVSLPTVVRMIGNVLVESIVGVVPLVGDAFDFVWKSNSKNVRLLRADLADPEHTRRSSIAVVAVSIAAVVALVAITAAAMAVSVWLVVRLLDSAF